MKKKSVKKIAKTTRVKKDITISELAGMVARGFTEVKHDMSDLETRLTVHINAVEHKVDLVRDSVNELSFESRKMRTRLENLELKVFGSVQEL